MIDYIELKRLAEATNGWDNLKSCWPEETEDGDLEVNWFVGAVTEDDDKYPIIEINTAQYDALEDAGRLARFYAAANPDTVLSLLDQIEAKQARIIELAKAANAARDEAGALRKDAERYRWLRDTENWNDAEGHPEMVADIWIIESYEKVFNRSGEKLDQTIDYFMDKETDG